ncbi:MAG: hypothetical protein D6706_22200 [Chloroflexi bacterium]|nr:MAG: hypothetical protein D6706_22200 [Chloroflexota bacterium]
MNQPPNVIHARLVGLLRVIMLGFLLVALALVYWATVRSADILGRDDNPRLVEAELRIRRGRILDRHNQVLAESVGEEIVQRVYPIPEIGPAVGYYSFLHGTAGVEESLDEILRGETADFWRAFWRQVRHLPQQGRDVQLTLDADLQKTADSLLGNQRGAIILLSLPDNEILAMVSHPNFDPNLLDEQFDALSEDENAPLLNRVTQGQYQPGRVLQPFLLAWAWQLGLIAPEQPIAEANKPVSINGGVIRCTEIPPDVTTWADVLKFQCPAPMQILADRMGAAGLDQSFMAFGLTTPPVLPLNTETAVPEPVADPLLAGIGQENLVVTPLQMALAWAALGSDGRLRPAQLVTAVQDESGEWVAWESEEMATGETAVSAATARLIRRLLTTDNNQIEFSVPVLSGPQSTTNSWYLGMAPASAPQFAIVVIVEQSTDPLNAITTGRNILEAALTHP